MEPLDNFIENESNSMENEEQILLWTKVGMQNASEMLRAAYQSELNNIIHRTSLPQNDPYFDELSSILLFYSQNKQYSSEQLSCALSILALLFQLCTRNCFGDLQEAIYRVHRMIGIHMSHRPPKSIDVFTMKEGIELLDFFTDNFLLLWKFYKYVWTADIRVVPVFTHETEERIKEEPADVDVHPENEKTLLKVDKAEKGWSTQKNILLASELLQRLLIDWFTRNKDIIERQEEFGVAEEGTEDWTRNEA